MTDIKEIEYYFVGGTCAKKAFLEKGQFVVTHKHTYDHLSILAGGAVEVDVDGVKTEYRGVIGIEIKAEKFHTITALEDSYWFCVHATDALTVEDMEKDVIAHE